MKLSDLAEEYGYGNIYDAIEGEGWHTDAVVPGACKVKGCDYYTDVEPDGRGYDCDDHRGTVDSVLLRAGII